jgi:hypothetical protein
MSKIGIDDVIIAKILNHSWVNRQVTSVYNRWQKLPEMRRVLERWGARLERIVASHLLGKGEEVRDDLKKVLGLTPHLESQLNSFSISSM